jgi:hypothetical protein
VAPPYRPTVPATASTWIGWAAKRSPQRKGAPEELNSSPQVWAKSMLEERGQGDMGEAGGFHV